MTSAESRVERCDVPNCTNTKVHRVRRELRYCNTCYSRLFKRLMCPSCGNFGRLLVLDKEVARCRHCEAKDPCVRCLKSGKPVGLMTRYGPACTSCAHHFHDPEPCEKCGELSTRLARVLRLDSNLRCCPRCAREDAATCPGCRRHRFLVERPDGQWQCRLCTEIGEKQCQTCSQLMPAGRVTECEDCSWKKSFDRRVRIHTQEFEQASLRERFIDFCAWLQIQMGAHKAALKLKSYLSFFAYLDTHPAGLPAYILLLNHFNADGLRRMQTPMLWLKERYGVQADNAFREEHSDRRRIQEMLDSVPPGVAASALGGYRGYLTTRQAEGSTTLRSVRLSMRAAKSLLLAASEKLDALPTQDSVTVYLTHTPGQKAAVQGFIGYLNRTHDLSLKAEVSDRAVSRARTQKLEATLKSLSQNQEEGGAYDRNWIKTALMLLHGLSSVNKKSLSYSSQSYEGEIGFSVIFKTQTYWVPAPGGQVLLRSEPS